MDIEQLSPQALTALAERIHYAQALIRPEDGGIAINLIDHTRKRLSIDEVKARLLALVEDMRLTADLIQACVEQAGIRGDLH